MLNEGRDPLTGPLQAQSVTVLAEHVVDHRGECAAARRMRTSGVRLALRGGGGDGRSRGLLRSREGKAGRAYLAVPDALSAVSDAMKALAEYLGMGQIGRRVRAAVRSRRLRREQAASVGWVTLTAPPLDSYAQSVCTRRRANQ